MSKKTKDWGKIREETERELEQENELLEEEESASEELDDDNLIEDDEEESVESLKVKDYREQMLRMQAELVNVRKRAEREVQNAHRYGTEKLINDLLPVMDSLDQALQIAKDNNDKVMGEGIELTVKLFLGVLAKNNVTELNPIGEPFNPQEHEAMSMLEDKDAQPHTVLSVFQKGYKLFDRVIRPARVIVSK